MQLNDENQPFNRFILELGKALGLSHNTMATGAVYFHRFYMFHNFQDFPKYVSLLRDYSFCAKTCVKFWMPKGWHETFK